MALIHSRSECLTGYQERSPWSPGIDLQVDFVMVYGVDESMPRRVREFREKGYVVHLMTGAAWGEYQDYFSGAWDGREHWEESQVDRRGESIMHGVHSPYLCPTPSFARYLAEKLQPAVDAGVEAIHLEEPEYWDTGGYGPAFRRAWREYYGEEWRPPHESCENRYRASALKVFLFRRLIAEVSAAVKAYARERGRELAFHVPTHSLVNYTQWKILSPEGTLLDVPTVDGCIAQVWTGTARVGNVCAGRYAERTFETAFLEYGIMQELVRGTGRRMWFLHDPVEDNPEYTWASFRENYLKTVVASLMHPAVSRYEAAPWPERIFHGVYPKKGQFSSLGLLPGQKLEGAQPIPPAYAELICTLIQTLGDMDQADCGFLGPAGDAPLLGLVMADSGLYQRSFPDSVPGAPGGSEALNSLLLSLKARAQTGEDVREESRRLMARIADDPALYHDYVASGAFPHFFGLAMPLLKAGLPLRPVQLENILRGESFSDFSALILSYEWMKPRDPRENEALAAWVRAGGTLLLTGDGGDPYHKVRAWWNTGKYNFVHPAQHLCTLLGLPPEPEEGVYPVCAGRLALRKISPARITLSPEAAESWVSWVLSLAAPAWQRQNAFVMKRGPYRIAAVMEECASDSPLSLKGSFADLFSEDYALLTEKTLSPGETALLFDLEEPGEALQPVASTARLERLTETPSGYLAFCRAAENVRIRMRLRLPRPVFRAEGLTESGARLPADQCLWDDRTRTLFVSFPACRQLDMQLFANEQESAD